MGCSYSEEAELESLQRKCSRLESEVLQLEQELARVRSDNRDLSDLIVKLNMHYFMGY